MRAMKKDYTFQKVMETQKDLYRGLVRLQRSLNANLFFEEPHQFSKFAS